MRTNECNALKNTMERLYKFGKSTSKEGKGCLITKKVNVYACIICNINNGL